MFRALSKRTAPKRVVEVDSRTEPPPQSPAVAVVVPPSSSSSTADLQRTQFRRAALALQSPKVPALSNDAKLQLYAYFKQAEKGPCTGSRPGMLDVVNRSKYDAWKALGDMSSEQAMAEYIQRVTAVYGGTLPSDGMASAEVNGAPSTTAPTPPSPAPAPAATQQQQLPISSTSNEVKTNVKAMTMKTLLSTHARDIGFFVAGALFMLFLLIVGRHITYSP